MAMQMVPIGVVILISQLTAVCGSNEGQKVFWGLQYTQNTMLSSQQPSLLPDMARVGKISNYINHEYKLYMKAIDDVLQLYDLQQRIRSSSHNSTEIKALEAIVDIVTNQTCDWIESLNMTFNSNGKTLRCNSTPTDPMADIRKLYTILSAYHLISGARNSTLALGLNRGMSLNFWWNISGIQHTLSPLLSHTRYHIHLMS